MGTPIPEKETGGESPLNKKCLTVEVENLDPWAVVALFKYAQNVCRRNGLSELVEVGCSITVTFAGSEDVNLEVAKATLEKWQDARVSESEAA